MCSRLTELLQLKRKYVTMLTYLSYVKGGSRVNDGRTLHCQGGSTKAQIVRRDGQTAATQERDTRNEIWGFVAYRQAAIRPLLRRETGHQTRGKQINTLALPVAPRLSSISFQPVD